MVSFSDMWGLASDHGGWQTFVISSFLGYRPIRADNLLPSFFARRPSGPLTSRSRSFDQISQSIPNKPCLCQLASMYLWRELMINYLWSSIFKMKYLTFDLKSRSFYKIQQKRINFYREALVYVMDKFICKGFKI